MTESIPKEVMVKPFNSFQVESGQGSNQPVVDYHIQQPKQES